MAQHLVVLIPTSNRADLLQRTLDSLSQCRFPANYRGTVVVENGQRKVSESIALGYREALHLRYVYLPIGNKSLALNTVLEGLGDVLVVFFDDDIRVDPGILEAYAAAAEGVESGQFFGGPFDVDYVEPPPEWLKPFLPKAAVGWDPGPRPRWVERGEAFLGFNWAAFSSDIRKLGGFSTDHGPGSPTNSVGQETEMEGRLMDNGIRGRYVPDARVWHFVPPQRCSKEFASSQTYRWGIQGGLGYSGSLLRLFRRWFVTGFKSLMHVRSSNPAAFFEPYMQYRRVSGLIRGRFIHLTGKC
jgi:glycosyltransferase involved in cell wall biosynthesis